MTLYHLNVTLHVLAAILWLGGMFFLSLVGAPVLRGLEPESLRADVFRRIGARSRTVGWGAIAVLLATGVANLRFHGLLHGAVLRDPAFWSGRYGSALAWKLAAVAVMLVVQALHDFVLGPRASRLEPGSPEAIRSRRAATWLGRVNGIVGVLLVLAAVRLARGG